jgi:8-oxo-dGTP pyrophosphatase MutT (NUDIX family)
MPKETSAGAVIFRKNGEIKFLVLQYGGGYWDFSRGHIEQGESEEETARREIAEETGLKDLEFIPGFREKTFWFFRKEGQTIYKEAIILLAKTTTDKITISSEHQDYKWLNYEEAMKVMTFKNAKAILEKANKFLKTRISTD